MRRLSLDFGSAQRALAQPKATVGLGLLLLGAIVLASVAWTFNQQVEANAVLRAQRDRLASRLRPVKLPQQPTAENSAQFDQASAAYAQIMTPWDALLGALENTRGGEVALLSLTADAARREFALSGEAKDFPALSKFSDALSANAMFVKVALVDHKLSDGAAPPVVKFDLTLAWRQNADALR